MKTIAVATILLTMGLSSLFAGELGIDINGFAYHYNAKTFYDTDGRERPLNGVNKGLGHPVHHQRDRQDHLAP